MPSAPRRAWTTTPLTPWTSSPPASIRERLNGSVALGVVVNRPRDLTRETLKEVRLLLDGAGYSEARLESAWRNATHHEIAASIVGHIRRFAEQGGIKRLDAVLDHHLDEVLEALNDALWEASWHVQGARFFRHVPWICRGHHDDGHRAAARS
ncbi:type I restriction-modification enzyme R subunit C-terminal domain-containing protein [uncultured Halomonas sp.]|uniref:type I restriction-modification enzyme R subunit C-terminal domain-containing protein n=1 Tax=uncultured Halomonas sp. TaxID=173971 RepID=UPI00262EB63D|nr:type I restriction-modification enzyme R subunit C-terminal domain-containing protein [uncultured Halomonas sp.]